MRVIRRYYNQKASFTFFTFLLAALTFVTNPLKLQAQTYSGPLVITKGGTYTGNWQSTDSEVPAVDVRTSEPVIIINSNVRGAGYLIRSWAQSANLTVRNTNGYGLTPTPYKDYKKPRRFVTVDNFQNVVVENCYLEGTAGIYLGVRYEGNGTTSNTIKIRYNKVKNIDGRIYGGQKDLVQFVQFNFRGQIPHAEVAWNQVINEPNQSMVEDNINMHNVKGTASSPIRIHNNYIQGAYPMPATATSYSGGGILMESTSDLSTSTSHVVASDNHLVNFGNHGMGIAGGNNIRYHHNRLINSALFKDGTRFSMYTGGLWSRDYYHNGSTFANSIDNNTLGVMGWNWPNDRNDYSIKEGANYSNNTSLPGVITLLTEQSEHTLWLSKVSKNGLVIGPKTSNTPTTTTPAVPTGTGKITLDKWTGISGSGISAIPVNASPNSTTEVALFEAPSNVGDNFGQRIRGFVTAPYSGDYTFWVAGDDFAELWLSPSENPAQKAKLASVPNWTNPREWTKYAAQKSAKVRLEAGKRYYIEALAKENVGGDNLAVGWQLPNGTLERPIAGTRLTPFKATATTTQYTVKATAGTGGTVALSAVKATYAHGEKITLSATPKTGYRFSGWSGSATGTANPLQLTVSSNTSITANFTQQTGSPTTPTGKITREYWARVSGSGIGAIPVNNQPTSITQLSSFEAPTDVADNYGQRIRGYVTAPATGHYTFWIAGDNDAELRLSTSEDPAKKVRIASVKGWTTPRDWTKYSSQKSVRIWLEAGKRYYIEALAKEDLGGDNLAVGWQLPNGALERPIAGNRLSPVSLTYSSSNSISSALEETVLPLPNTAVAAYPNPFQDVVTLDFGNQEAELQEILIYDQPAVAIYKSTGSSLQLRDNKLEIRLSGENLKPGIYILKYLDVQGNSSSMKLLKTR